MRLLLCCLACLLARGERERVRCSKRLSAGYSKANATAEASLRWCTQARDTHGVLVSRSFGSLPSSEWARWDALQCNELVTFGRHLSCDDTLGLGMVSAWLRAMRPVVTGDSRVDCALSEVNHLFCSLRRVTVDFGKARLTHSNRVFEPGFVTYHGAVADAALFARLEGLCPGLASSPADYGSACEVTETRAVFVVGHDDVFNLGHHLEDLLKVWSAGQLAGEPLRDALLLVVDNLVARGPAGEGRLMSADQPDHCGPFCDYYRAWFGERSVLRAADFGAKRVCFERLLLPTSGRAWVWQDWSAENACSLRGPSPLWQAFAAQTRGRLQELYGLALPRPAPRRPLVLLVLRVGGSRARIVANGQELAQAIRALTGARVDAVDLAALSFREQYLRVQAASVLLGMHGAGVAHATSMQVGLPGCCALLEMFPAADAGFSSIHGYGNAARWVGVRYVRYQTPDGREGSAGTAVEANKVALLVKAALARLRRRPSCINGNLSAYTQ